MSILLKLSGFVKKNLFYILILTPLILVIISVPVFAFLFKFYVSPSAVLVTNLTDKGVSISWTTPILTKGLVVISEDGKFPVLPMFTKTYEDDLSKNLKGDWSFRTHHVTINNLRPKTKYKFRVYRGIVFNVFEGEFQTGIALSSPSVPQLVYGKVLKASKEGLAGVLVYFQIQEGKVKSLIQSTLTNSSGGFTFDISSLRRQNLDSYFEASDSAQEIVIVNDGSNPPVSIKAEKGKDKPLNDIILGN